MNMTFYRKLPIPQEVKKEYPVTPEMAAVKAARDREIRRVFEGSDERLLLIIGPCSADRSDAVSVYLEKLRRLYDRVRERLIVIPRIYTNKPRTTSEGYKGMLHQPDPHAHPDMYHGIIACRQLHMAALRDFDLSSADEMLYPDNHRYFSDLLSYVTVGARSVENQQHRLTASGLDIPVGLKNPTGGDVSVMLNGIFAAHHSHTFLYRGWEVESRGNPLAHAVLRGYHTPDGIRVENYHAADLQRIAKQYGRMELPNPAIIVDTNHDNSGKDYRKQADIALEVLKSRRESPTVRGIVRGLMIESYLVDGAQTSDGDVFGQSITDPCLGWEKTEDLVLRIADALQG